MDIDIQAEFDTINKKLDRLSLKSRAVGDTAWLDTVLTQLKTNGIVDAFAFVEGNYLLLASLGLDVTHAVLTLISKGQSNAAQVILDSRMTPDQASVQAGTTAANLAAQTAAHEKFIKDVGQFLESLLPVVAKLVLTAAATAVTGGLAGGLAL